MKYSYKRLVRLGVGVWVTTLFAIAPALGESPEKPAAPAVDSGSEVQGKRGGMGRSYQQNVPGPGEGSPDYRGGRSEPGDDSSPAGKGSRGEGGEEAEETGVTEQEVRSFRARDGSGYGTGDANDKAATDEQGPPDGHYGSNRSSSASRGKMSTP